MVVLAVGLMNFTHSGNFFFLCLLRYEWINPNLNIMSEVILVERNWYETVHNLKCVGLKVIHEIDRLSWFEMENTKSPPHQRMDKLKMEISGETCFQTLSVQRYLPSSSNSLDCVSIQILWFWINIGLLWKGIKIVINKCGWVFVCKHNCDWGDIL